MRVRRVIGHDLYTNEKAEKTIIKNSSWPRNSDHTVFLNPQLDYCAPLDQSLYVIYQKDMNHNSIDLSKLEREGHNTIFDDDQISVSQINSKGTFYETYKAYFETILKVYGVSDKTNGVIDSLAVLEYLYGRGDAYIKWVKMFEAIPKKTPFYIKRVTELKRAFKENIEFREPCSNDLEVNH